MMIAVYSDSELVLDEKVVIYCYAAYFGCRSGPVISVTKSTTIIVKGKTIVGHGVQPVFTFIFR